MPDLALAHYGRDGAISGKRLRGYWCSAAGPIPGLLRFSKGCRVPSHNSPGPRSASRRRDIELGKRLNQGANSTRRAWRAPRFVRSSRKNPGSRKCPNGLPLFVRITDIMTNDRGIRGGACATSRRSSNTRNRARAWNKSTKQTEKSWIASTRNCHTPNARSPGRRDIDQCRTVSTSGCAARSWCELQGDLRQMQTAWIRELP